MALFILTALVGITYDQIYSFRADQSKKTASIAINSIVKEVNDVYFLGPGAMKTIIVRLPDGIDFNKSFIEDRTIWLNVFGSDVFATTSVDVRGIWPGEDGTFSFTITAYDDYVSISIRPVDVTPNSVNEYLVQGESKKFSITLHNGSDLDKYYLMVIDFPLSEVSLSSNHEDLIEVFYGETQLIDYSISCGLDSFGSYEGKIIFVPIDSSDENITIPVNLFCSSLQTKLKVYPSTKHFYTTTNSITSDSVLVCNTTSRDFSSSSASVSGSIAPYVVTSFSEPILANSCSTLNFVINAPSTVSSYLGSLSVGSGGYVAGVDLNLLTYSPSDAIRFSWDEAYFGIDGKSINDINLLVLVGPYTITQATVLFLNDIDDANVIGLYLSNRNNLPLNSKLSSGDWSSVSDFNLARRKSYDLNITFDADIRNDSEKFRIILKSSDGTYFWSPVFDPTNSIVDNNASHFSNLKQGQEPIYPKSENLIALWRMNDKNSDGWILNSISGVRDGNLFNGADVNGIGPWDTNAVYFDGVNDYVSLDVVSSISDRFTVSAWVYPTRLTPQAESHGNTILATSFGYGIWLLHNSGKIRAYAFTNSTSDYFETTTYVELNKWQHIVLTAIRNGDARIYYNGELVLSFTAANLYNWAGVLGVGDLRLNRHLTHKGLIDDVAIWNTALSAEDVREIYSIGSGVRDFNTQADGNGLYLSRNLDGNFVTDGNFYSRVFDFNGRVDFSQIIFNKINSSPYLFFKDNNLNNNYSLNSFVFRKSDNSFTPTGELDSNILDRGNELTSSNSLFDANLAGLWHLNSNGSGIDYNDSSLNLNTGSCSSTCPTKTSGLWDTNAALFSSGKYVDLNKKDSLNASSALTLSAWIKMTSANTNNGILFKGALSSSQGVYSLGFFNGSSSKLTARLNGSITEGSGQLTSPNVLFPGVWQHVVFVYDGSKMYLYENGLLVASNNYSTPINITTETLKLGCYYNTNFCFNGAIDEVVVWNRALSASDVNTLYVSQKGNWLDNNLVGYWKFNSSNGTTILDYARGNAGTLTGSGASINYKGLWDSNSFYGNGSSYYINVPYSNTLKSTSFTFSIWINFTTSQTGKTLMGYHSDASGGASIGIDDSTANLIKFHTNSYSTVLKSTTALNDGVWHNVVGTYSGGTSKLYVDGVLNNSRTGVPDPTLNTNAFQIGKWVGGSQYFLGYIDEVKVYTRVLSAAEIAFDYNKILTSKFINSNTIDADSLVKWDSVKVNSDVNYSFGKEICGAGDLGCSPDKFNDGLVGLWHMNNDSVDSSGNNFNGTWEGSEGYSTGLWGTNSANFDGATDYVSIPSINTGSGTGLTGCGWVKRFGALNNLAALFSFNNLKIRFTSDGRINDRAYNYLGNISSDYYSYNSIPLNKWTLVCVTYSTTGSNVVMDFYFNGVLDRSIVTDLSGLVGINSSGYIGMCQDVSSRKFSGFIEEASIWNRKLSNLEIIDLYRKGISRLDLNVYSCSDSLCANKTSSSYLEYVQNNSSINLDSNIFDSQYLGFDAFFKKASGLEDYNARNFWVSSFIKDINFIYSQGLINLYARSSANGYSWSDWSSALTSPQNDLSIFDGNYFQYKLFISSTSPSYSPILRDVNVTYNRISN